VAFASGKYAYRISDRSGFRFKIKDTRKEWNGSIVGKDEYEEKHPQLEPTKVRADNEAIKNARPDRDETSVPNLLPLNAFKTTNSSTTISVNEPNHNRSSSDTVRFRDAISIGNVTADTLNSSSGYSITKIDTNNYSFITSTTANTTQKGGGGSASAGPVAITN
tara:strand:+ start:2094 stop:2585 length:492 start_codon:yes stop_codon:yes gene_type:complete